MLHVTNGDATRLAECGFGGKIIVWRDILHDGPVPANLNLDAMSQARAEFLHELIPGLSFEKLVSDFRARDQALMSYADHERVLLWFEADLYDQLQILQILDWFADHRLGDVQIQMICIGEFPGVEPFWGLGQLEPEQLKSLLGGEQTLTKSTLQLAAEVWRAYCSPDPFDIERILRKDLSALPYLAQALERHLQQFPALGSGLALTERLILEWLLKSPSRIDTLFMATQSRESRPFLGDSGFLDLYLRPLIVAEHPLVEMAEGDDLPQPQRFPYDREDWQKMVKITDVGREVLATGSDHIELNGIDRWRGGVHLYGRQIPWRWDENGQCLVNT